LANAPDVEAEVADQHDQIDRRAQHAHVLLDRVAVAQRPDAQRVATLEDAGHRRPVGHADDRDLEAVLVEDHERLDDVLQAGRVGVDRILEQVVRRQQRELRPARDLIEQVDRAQVELVVADHRGVHAGVRQGPHLDLALEQVEHRGALEAVARVEPQRAVRRGADALHQRRDAGDPAERLVDGLQPVVFLEPVGHEVVREQPRVDVGGVDDGQAHVLADEIGALALDRAAGHQHAHQADDEPEPAGGSGTHRGRIAACTGEAQGLRRNDPVPPW
jgi:hypothetical protein